MSRYIDKLPEPPKRRKPKVIVATASRTGTLSVYEAMKILGYKTYHMSEVVQHEGIPHMQILIEAIQAQYNRFSGIPRYTRQDFDKWFAEYDCLIEVPYYMGPAVLEAYADDPDVKFILTERSPDKWVSSINGTAGGIVLAASSQPLKTLMHFDAYLYWFIMLNRTVYGIIGDSTRPGDARNREAVRRNYVEYIQTAKNIIPAERLCSFRLEDGLGWEQICPFLGVPIPDEEFPGANLQENFKKTIDGLLRPRLTQAAINMFAVTVPILASAAWVGFRYRHLLK